MNETVDVVAQSFLKQLVKKGMKPVPVQHANFYGETYVESIQRMDREFRRNQRLPQERPTERFEINEKDVPDKFVLKCHKKYFYGFKGSETKWTYESRLALRLSEIEAQALMGWLAEFGTPVNRFLAPRGA
jgi:hypothetical protein